MRPVDEPTPSFDAVLAAAARSGPGAADGPRPAADHPPVEELAAYHHGQMAPARGEEIREHLALCPECSDLLLELEAFEADPAPGAAQVGVVDFEEAAAWRHLSDRLQAAGEPVTAPAAAPPRRRRAAPAWAPALAAAALVACVGLGLGVAALRTEVAELRRPQGDVPIVNLEPAGYTRSEPETVSVGPGERFVVLLNPPSFPHPIEHRVEILDGGGRRVWAGSVRPTEAGNFHLGLSRSFLPPGAYRIRLHGGTAESSYDLVVPR